MKKNIFKLVKLICVSAILLACVSCADSPKPDLQPTSEELILGTWFWNYGYNQDLFANEIVTFCEDGTIDISRITPEDIEYDKGTYSIIDDAKHGATLLINLNWYKYIKEDYVEEEPNLNLNIYYALGELTKERLMFSRYRRDFSAMGGPTYEFDPPVFNDYSRIKNGTKEHLIGKWKFNKRGTPGATWEEIWIFNEDGTMESFYSEGADLKKYKGMYEVLADENGSVLHQILTQESEDGTTYTTLTQPMEFWYEYFINNENVINVNCTKDKIDGEEHIKNPAIENFYYRDIELEEITYHWENYTFKDYYPKGTDYEVLDLGKMYLFEGVHRLLKEHKLFGWYDNPQLQGNPVTKIPGGTNNNIELWAKWGIYYSKNVYDSTKGKDGYNYNGTLPVSVLAPQMALPKKGDTITVAFSGKVSKDFNGGCGIVLVDCKDEWFELGYDWHILTLNNGYFSEVFKIKIKENPTTDNYDDLWFDFNYENSAVDDEVIISDFKFEVIVSNPLATD
ncbi:MAG: hypothetical protein J5710_00575 [Treponema sp.]|nr:hypothetical protein [Treponema sp.]